MKRDKSASAAKDEIGRRAALRDVMANPVYPRRPAHPDVVAEINFLSHADQRFLYLYRYLRMNAAYWYVHQATTNKEEIDQTKYFRLDLVQRTYVNFGNVFSLSFLKWYNEIARKKFENSTTQNNGLIYVPELLDLKAGKDLTPDDTNCLAASLNYFLANDRPNFGKPETVVLAIPLVNDQNLILDVIKQILKEKYSDLKPPIASKTYSFRKGVQITSLRDSFDILMVKAVKGMSNVDIARGKEGELPRQKLKALDVEEKHKRKTSGNPISKKLSFAKHYSENAARGIFFSNLPEFDFSYPEFDYSSLRDRTKLMCKEFEMQNYKQRAILKFQQDDMDIRNYFGLPQIKSPTSK